MTLSNFNQTDKQVQQWFLLLPDGHEGPYSLEQLELKVQEGLSLDCKIWREGSEESLTLGDLFLPTPPAFSDDLPPDLPPLPEQNEDSPPELPEDSSLVPDIHLSKTKESSQFVKIVIGVVLVLAVFIGVKQLIESPAEVSWSRPQKMTVETYRELNSKIVLKNWNQELFFYEATAPDYSRFWLVTPQFYQCDIEAQFIAEEGDILSLEDVKKISFRSKTKLENHVAEFVKFDFEDWPKLVPGFYKMNLTATNCEWSSLQSKIVNWFQAPPSKIELSYRIAISAQSVEFLTNALKKLAEEKYRLEQTKKLAADQFWQDVQQKYQTLLAVSLQIEQHFLDFLNSDQNWQGSLKIMVDKYTRQFGSLLTNFVVSNEEDFKKIRDQKAKNLSVKTAYENKIRLSAKNMGLQSMTLIEEWQKLPSKTARTKRKEMEKKVKDTFSVIKKDIEQKLIDVTEEQSQFRE